MNDIFSSIYIIICVHECVFACCHVLVTENYKEFDYITCITPNFTHSVSFSDATLLQLK